MKRMLTKFVLFAPLTLVAHPALAANTCSGEMMVPEYICARTEPGTDIRLFVEEFQTCENGQITEFNRSVSGLFNSGALDLAGSQVIDGKDIEVTYSPERTVVPNRADDLTMIYPTAATIHTTDGRFEMQMTTTLAPNYEGASEDEQHYLGSYKRFDLQGKEIESGHLSCSIIE